MASFGIMLMIWTARSLLSSLESFPGIIQRKDTEGYRLGCEAVPSKIEHPKANNYYWFRKRRNF